MIPAEIKPEDLILSSIEEAHTIPSKWYSDKNIFDFEQSLVVNNVLQYVGSISQIPKVGDFFLFELMDIPFIVVHDEENEFRAFYNVCKHRGGPLAFENGNCKQFQCKYHGWTYKLDGSLRGTPEFEGVENFDRKNLSLSPVQLFNWEGLLFISLNNPLADSNKLTNGIEKKILPNKIRGKKFYKRIKYFVNCNWKVYVDNYLEGYHLPFVHPELLKLLSYKEYITETSEFHSLQYSPLHEEGNFYGAGDAYYYFLFPNMMLNILPGRLQVNLVQPLSVNKTHIIFDYYYDVSSKQNINVIEEDIRYSDEVQQEDILICEKVQQGLKSGAYDKGRYSVKTELGVHHFHNLLRQFYNSKMQD
jgi:choline monooxygenase